MSSAFGNVGVLFATYTLLAHGLRQGNPTRLNQITKWLEGADGNGDCLIIFDECHKAKNLVTGGTDGESP